MAMMNGTEKSSWDVVIKQFKNRMNRVFLLDRASMPLFCAGTLSAFLVYLMRRQEAGTAWIVLAAAVFPAAVLLWSWLKVRRNMFRESDSRAFLDEQLGLHGALSAAGERDVRMPSCNMNADYSYKWRSFKSFYWMLGGAAMLALGSLLPVVKDDELAATPYMAVPPELARVEEMINQLEENQDIDNESLESLKDQFDGFMKKDVQDLYSHASLEASDALKAHTETVMMDFAKSLDQVKSALREMQAEANAGRDAGAQDLTAALKAMENNTLKPDGELAQALANIDPATVKQMTPEQMKQIMDKLKEASNCMNGMCDNGAGIMNPDDPEFGPMAGNGNGAGGKEGEGEDGDGPGKGGVGRGRGDAPMAFNLNESEKLPGEREKVDADDMEHAALGDMVGTQIGGHEVDPELRHQVEQSGAAAGSSAGGEAVWSDHVTPREREALRKIFD